MSEANKEIDDLIKFGWEVFEGICPIGANEAQNMAFVCKADRLARFYFLESRIKMHLHDRASQIEKGWSLAGKMWLQLSQKVDLSDLKTNK